MSTKRCTHCGQVLSLTDFYKHNLSKDGRSWQCKECHKERSRIWSKTASGAYSSIRGRTNFYKNKEFNLDREEFIEWFNKQPKVCHYCGITKEEAETLEGFFNETTKRLTVDCMDNELGYRIDNIVLACHKCNFVKSNIFTHDEMIEIADKYLKPKLEKIRQITRNE